jgi:hypothetical protein
VESLFPSPPKTEIPSPPAVPSIEEIDAFMKSLSAATAGLPSQKVEQLRKQKMEMEAEEKAAIASISSPIENPSI